MQRFNASPLRLALHPGLCPSGNAWVDYPTDNNVAHAALTECSNMGICNRITGRCSCREGFTGEACQRLACPNDCNGRGRCISMRDAASSVIDGEQFDFEGIYEGWDADMIHGCVCDDGWDGYDCSLRCDRYLYTCVYLSSFVQ